MSSGPRDDLRARMAQLLDRELVERAGARLSAQAQQEGAQVKPEEPKAELSTQDRLARDVWQIAAKALRMPEDQLDPEENLANLGIDSIAITEVMVQISRHFGISVAPTTFFEAKHLDDLSAILFDRHGKAIAGHYEGLAEAEAPEPEPVEAAGGPGETGDWQESWTARHRAAALRRSVKGEPAKPAAASTEPKMSGESGEAVPIAILSMEGMFPQSPDLEAFEAHLAAGDDCIEEIPADRWDWRAVFGDPKKGAFTDVKYGGFVPQVDRFDAAFFNISPREAELMDPQHRLFMECVWSLIEKGGYAPGALAGKNIGLFLGINLLDYTDMVNRAGIMEAQQLTGLGHAFCPNRLSFLLDIHGPSEVVDTACSSSLVAIHRAVMSIRHEGCEMAIAGGSNLMLSPTQHIMFSKVGMIAPDGRCKTFSKDANGYARADGVGAVLLKRLDLAERDGDPILGVIRGSVEHHGGGATSLTAPNPKAQARLIVEAHRQAGTDPRSIGLIECHGTGTPLGDPIEIEGLKLAFGELYCDRGLEPPAEPVIGLGSVKTNIGHAETAAGVAGLIKVLLAMKSGTRYRTLHCDEPNPLLDLAGSPFHLLQQAAPWQRPVVDGTEQPRRAGLSSFGAGGANVHLVIEEYRPPPKSDAVVPDHPHPVVVPVSAKSDEALRDAVARLRTAAGVTDLTELAYTLQIGRDAMRCRAAFVATDRDDLLRKLDAFLAGDNGVAATGEIAPGRREKTEALDPEGKDADAVAERWASGGDVDWLRLYGDHRPHRIALPGYAFQRKRFWLPEDAKKVQAPNATLAPSPEGKGRYRLRLTGYEVFLADHRVGGTPVLPGVAYLEFARAAAEQDGIADPELRQVVWMTPLKVDRPVTVTCEISRLDDGGARAEIVTCADEGDRVVHAQMRIATGAEPAGRTVDLEALRNASAHHFSASDIYAAFDTMGLGYGPGHRVISDLAVGSHVLARIELPEVFRPGLGDYGLHPSLMDGALQSAIGLALDEAGGAPTTAALPFSVDTVEILGPCEATMWAHVRGGPATGAGLRKMDIDLIADDGSVRVALRGFTTRALRSTDDADLLCFEPGWRLFAGTSETTDDCRRIVLMTAGTGDADALGGRLPGWDCRELDDQTNLPLQQRYSALAGQLLTIGQEVLNNGPVTLQLVLSEGEGSEALSGLGAMLRSLHREHPKIGGQVLTIGAGTDADTLVRLLRHATAAPAGASLKADGQNLSMEVWDEVTTRPETPSAPWRQGGVYLITGGTGRLGRHLARDILGKASDATVTLAARNDPDPDLSAWVEADPRLHHARVDLTDERAVVELVEAIRKDHGRLDGVFHAAGVVQDDALARKTQDQVAAVLAPKVTGAVALDKAIGDAPLDFLVFYSSISGVTGNTGQADYAAANAFLDGFAEEREARRRKGLCHGRTRAIAWPLWQDGGMGLDPAQQDLMRRTTGLVPLETGTGIEALYAALEGTSSWRLVTVGNAARIRRFIGSLSEQDVKPDQIAAASLVKTQPAQSADLRRLVLASLVDEASAQLKVSADDLDPDVELTEYGFDSIGFTQFANRLNDRFDLELTPTLFFEYPTLDGLAGHLSEEETRAMAAALGAALPVEPEQEPPPVQPEPVPPVRRAFAEPRAAAPAENQPEDDLVAIIGMSGQFPGATDVDAFWQVLKDGRDCISEVPPERWDWRDYWGDPLSEPGKGNAKWGGFIDGIAAFDAPFFGISAPEAWMMDPQQRLLLTQAWRVMEDAGYAPSALAGSKTGVFIGTADTGYSRLISQAGVGIEGYSMTALAPSLGPNRISYFYDFHGPSVAVETACSSALIAVHRAVEAIRSGYCSAAIAGGINALLLPEAFVGFSKAGMLSPEGHCKPFSAKADGYTRGEGVGLVFLKSLADAERDGDRILAVIRASAENHGGHAASLTAPNPKAQAELLRTAYTRSGIDPRTVGYIEAHGTGTPLGDPIEVEALTSAFADLAREAEETFGPAPDQSCAIGSVKSNIGHLELAAGIAGLIKVLLQMRHGEIFRTLHCDELNPYLKLAGSPFHVAQQETVWSHLIDGDGNILPRRAGVSSFGFGGSNAHVVLEEYPAPDDQAPASEPSVEPELIILSAKSEAQLKEMADRLVAFLSEPGQTAHLSDIAHTLQIARDPMEFRLGFVAQTKAQVLERLNAWLAGETAKGIQTGRVKTNRKTMSVLESDGPLREAAAGLAERGRADDLLALWAGGFNVDWRAVRKGRPGNRISLPGYPFAETEFWVGKGPQASAKEPEASSTSAFAFDGSESFLRDHLVEGARVLPGVVSFELVRQALAHAGSGSKSFELTGHTWINPVSVINGPERLEVSLQEEAPGRFRYSIFATGPTGTRAHAQGILRALGEEAAPKIDLDAARAAANRVLDVADIYRRFEGLGLRYGPAHRAITGLWQGQGVAVARLELPAEADREPALNPSILDGALQALIGLESGEENGTALPYAVRRVAVYGRTGEHMWAVVRAGDKGASIDVCKEDGTVVVRLEDFAVRAHEQPDRPVPASRVVETASAASDEARHFATLRLVTGIAARTLEVDASELDVEAELGDFGFDSVTMTAFASRINAELGLSLTPADFFEYATLERLARHIAVDLSEKQLGFSVEAENEGEAEKEPTVPVVPAQVPETGFDADRWAAADDDDPVVIVGQSCCFPMAEDVDAFWSNLISGRDCITRIPADRWDWREIDGDPRQEPGKTNIHWGGFIDRVFEFDPLFFAISPREAKLMDPQQRLMLMHAWKAIEDAGHSPKSLAGQKVGVFVGTSSSGYCERIGEDTGGEGYVATGSVPSVGPNRISYFLDLHGPSEPVETACSSSLVALHRAVQAIRAGDCDMALVGGVNTIITPDAHINFARAGMLSPDGRCKTFSSQANGYVRGEGVGMLFIRRLSDAGRDGDPILGVVRATAINHGGHANSLTAPNTEAQADLLRTAYLRAGIDPRSVGYIEAHGTGTALGDPVEINALKSAFRSMPETDGRLDSDGCWLGSVKTNIGHLELAAGVAGVIKVLQQFEHRQLAPSLHCETINPYIDLSDSPFEIVRSARDWKPVRDENGNPLPLRAGISSFGFGGVNAHVVLEEYRPAETPVRADPDGPVVIVLSARAPESLKKSARNLLGKLESSRIENRDLGDLAFTLQVGRAELAERLAIVAGTLDDLVERLKTFLEDRAAPGICRGRAKPGSEAANAPVGDAGPHGIAEQWVAGGKVDWKAFSPGSHRRLRLPTYPFARDVYRIGGAGRPKTVAHQAARPHSAIASATEHDGQDDFRARLNAEAFYLRDHRIQGKRILPGAMSLELVRKAASEKVQGDGLPLVFSNVTWRRPVELDSGEMDLRVELAEVGDHARSFRLTADDGSQADYMRGNIGIAAAGSSSPQMNLEALKQVCRTENDPDWLYASYAALGIDYGPAFRAVTELKSGGNGVLARLQLPRVADTDGEDFVLHPSLIDAAFHAALVSFSGDGGTGPALPFGIDRMEILGPTAKTMWAHLRTASSANGIHKLDIDLADESGRVCVRIEGFSLRLLPPAPGDRPLRTEKAPEAFPLRRAAERYFIDLVARETEIDASAISLSAPLEDYGIDSVLIMQLTDVLERDFGPLSKTLFFEHQTLGALLDHFLDEHAERLSAIVGSVEEAPAQAVPAEARSETRRDPVAADEPIAIIGVAGRYPGARSMSEFWENLAAGRDSVTEVPAGRWDHSRYYDPVRQPGKTTCKWGGFVDGHDRFDPMFFNIAPREAQFMDPQERLFLQCAWETLEDAGYTRATVAPGREGLPGDVGVFVGVMWDEYQLYGPERQAQGQPLAIGTSPAGVANRVSYFCNFHGPSLTVDSMCSSSLTAIHLACDSLRSGSCSVALAGGVNLTPHPNKYLTLAQGRFLSTTGRCGSFGEGGDGYVPAEGVGAVLLKPMSRAEADGDRIYGVILGSALNHGGKTNGYTVPNPAAQTAVIEKAMERAGIAPEEVSYVEAHGTGTTLGDPIEIAALTKAWRGQGGDEHICAIGSVKSNIGHGESAAGIAGLTKILLQLKHRQLAPSLHAETLNPNIPFETSPFRVQRRLEAWPQSVSGDRPLPRIAGLSSFGAGGSNAHIVIAEHIDQTRPAAPAGPAIYPFSARDPERLSVLLANFRSALDDMSDADLPSVAITLQEGREAFEERVAIVAGEKADLTRKLNRALAGENGVGGIFRSRAATGRPTADLALPLAAIAEQWVQGAQVDWSGMRTGPKPPPISLPTYPFAEDYCWLPDIEATVNPPKPEMKPEPAPMPLLFTPVWQEQAPVPGTDLPAKERVVVLCGTLASDPDLAGRLERPGIEVVALEAPTGPVDGRYEFHAVWLMKLLQGLARKRPQQAVVQVVVPAENDDSLLEGLAGLLRCAALEHRTLSCQLVAVDEGTEDLAEKLAADATCAAEQNTIRYRQGRRLVRSWGEVAPNAGSDRSPWKQDGVYLLTGGAGGIGLHVAEAIAASRVRPSLWLTGRSHLKPEVEQRLKDLEAMGATVHYRRIDVTNRDAVTDLLSEIDVIDGRVDGVFHGAGITRDGLIASKDEATLRVVLAPKVTGTRVLDEALGNRPLDFLVLFASAAGALGNPGQADYAAANAFLDHFAASRNARVAGGACHGRTIAIDWPYWRDGGMHMDARTIEAMEREAGVRPLETAPAIAALTAILSALDEDQILVLEGDHDRLPRLIAPAEPAAAKPQPALVEAASDDVRRSEPVEASGGRDAVVAQIKACFSTCLGIPADRLAPDDTIDRFGVDSVSSLEIVEALEAAFGPLPQTILFEFPTINRLADELITLQGPVPVAKEDPVASTPQPTVVAPEKVEEPAPDAESNNRDIAIIAVAGRYPGADTIEAFGDLLREGRDCVTEIPADRIDLLPRYSPRKGEPGASYCKWGGFLSDVDCFDAEFFGYSPRAADLADPQERLFLQTAWRLFERAGHTRTYLAEHYDKRVGVFVGSMYQQYPGLASDPESRALLALSSYSGIANRTSFFFDCQGPSVAVDSMCSSGLQAVHQASQSLRAGECRLALAGGVNLSIHPAKYEALSRGGLVGSSPESRALSGGDGYLPAEGVGAVLLKPLGDALRDGDRVLAVIKGSLANHAGHSAGYAVPNADAQVRLIEDAFQTAGVDPATIGYAEVAANGTQVGDAIELRALGRVYADRSGEVPLAVGSVKSNMGHAEAASGLAQLTKVLLQFERRELFPSFGTSAMQTADLLNGTPFAPQTGLAPWTAPMIDGEVLPRRATVSSFGAGGSNVFLILEEGPPVPVQQSSVERRLRSFPVSARTEDRLAELRKALAAYVREAESLDMAALSLTLRFGRETFACRVEIVATDREELAIKLEDPGYREDTAPAPLAADDDGPRAGPMLVLPGYPFAKEKHWLPQAAVQDSEPEMKPEASRAIEMVQETEHSDPPLQLICRTLAAELGCQPDDLDSERTFEDLGVDSMVRMRLIYAIEEARGRALSQKVLETHATPQALARLLETETGDGAAPAVQAEEKPSTAGPYRCPLGEAQKGLWVLQSLYPESGEYNVPLAFRVKSADAAALAKALDWLVAEYPILGTRIVEEDGDPVLCARPEGVELHSLVMPKEVETAGFLRQRVLLPFDLTTGVFRVEHLSGGKLGPDESIVLLNAHHMITDGISSAVITRRFWSAYESFSWSEQVSEKGDSADYSDFAAWEAAFAASDEGQAQKQYWLEKLSDPAPVLKLPTKPGDNRAAASNGQDLEVQLPEDLTARLRDLARRQGVSPASVYLTAFATLLYRYTGEEDLVVGVPTLRRPSRRFAETVGYCANMIALRLAVDPNLSFGPLSNDVHAALGEGLGNSDIPFTTIAREHGGTATGEPPYQVGFAYQNFVLDAAELDLFARGDVTLLSEIRQAGGAQLGIEVQDDPKGASVIAGYDGDRFDRGTIERLLAHFRRLLEAAVTGDETPVSALRMLTRPETDRALHHWARGERFRPSGNLAHDRVFAAAQEHPSATAIVSGGKRHSYRDLVLRSKQIALALAEHGVSTGDRVAVLLEREPDGIAALLAVIALGAVWVPLDPDHPDERLAYILRDAEVALVLSRGALANRLRDLKDRPADVIDLDKARYWMRSRFARFPEAEIGPDLPAYIIYTSGSTGLPKGVVVSHGALSAHCQVIADEYGLSAEDGVLQFAPTAVDTAIEQILPPLSAGARLVLRSPDLQTADEFRRFLSEEGITVADLPPVYLHELLRSWDRSGADLSGLSLRLMIVGGEALTSEVAAAWHRSRLSGTRLVNAYGPTEATVTALVHTVKPSDGDDTIPIGRPLPGTEIYILDRCGNPAPDGVIGELYIGGGRLALGYHQRTDLTEDRFRIHRLGHKEIRLYATGDLACFRPNSGGVVEFHGRVDDQVKIRGHRIELGEVEAALAACGVAECAVLVERNKAGEPVLMACLGGEAEPFDDAFLRKQLADRLPPHMVPSGWVRLGKLPKTASGKIDRRALQRAERDEKTARDEGRPPRDQVEQRLLDVWMEVLGRDTQNGTVGVDEDFADAGGHSLLAVRLLNRIEQAFGCKVSVTDLAQAGTIATQARLLRQRGISGNTSEEGAAGKAVDAKDASLLVSLKQPAHGGEGESRPLVFLVHPIGGTLTCYQAMVGELNLDRPVYGIRAEGLEPGEACRKCTIEDMATRYCAVVREVQPHGPYTVCGWSFGGNVAWEMARQFAEEGEEIAFVGLIDSYLPEEIAHLEDASGLADIGFDRRCGQAFLRDLFGADVSVAGDEDILERVMTLPQLAAVLPGATRDQLQRLYAVFAANYEAFLDHVPGKGDVPVTLMRATIPGAVESTGYWREVAGASLVVRPVEADHYTILRPPHLKEWVPDFREAIERTDRPDNQAGDPSAKAGGDA
ncbi:amino acid adenylation domain-containing protein [uncultured Roseibium sp.]|uniref:amino acid adenylation domain-containing protein n=1 Tax=uncultured Roseibium sp. TaxID=1936171 RepID=UPI003216317B